MEEKPKKEKLRETKACPTCSRDYLAESGYNQCSNCLRDGVMLLRG